MIPRIPVAQLMVAGLFAAGLLLPARAPGDSGNVNWQDHFDRSGGFDSALAVAWAHGLIVVAGDTTNAAGDRDWTVRAYEPRSGDLVWQDHFDRAGGFDRALHAAVEGKLLIVTGRTTNPAGNMDWTIRAYDARTGALRWQSHFDRAGGFDRATAATIARDRLIVAGDSTTAAGDLDWSVRAHHPRSGAILWEDHFDRAGGQDRALAIVEAQGVAIAAGHTVSSSGGSDWSVRAHDARTGALRWEDHFDRAGGNDRAQAVAVSGNRVFVGGWTTSAQTDATVKRDWSVRAYEAHSGLLLWEDHFDRAGGHDTDFGIAAGEGLVVAAGRTMDAAGNLDWTVRAYEPRTGTLLWEDHFDRADGLEEAVAVAIAGGQVIVAGQSANAAGNQDWSVFAYDR